MQHLRFENDDGIGRLTFDRPDCQNAINVAMLEELIDLLAGLRDEPLRALVLAGAGDAFCSGLDLTGMSEMFQWLANSGAGTADPMAAGVVAAQDAPVGIGELPFPTIAAIRGACVGGGLELALACDFRIVARGATLALPEVKWGLIPDWGGTQRLPRLIGLARAKQLILDAQFVDAETACSYGLANDLVDDEELEAAADALARRLAERSPTALAQAKALLDAAHETALPEGHVKEATAQSACIRSPEVQAVAAQTRPLETA